jgi:hypothetical protein
MRLIDDYLFITTSIEKAKGFLDMMNQGHPEYGCFISKDKTLTNFDHGPELNSSVDSRSKGQRFYFEQNAMVLPDRVPQSSPGAAG